MTESSASNLVRTCQQCHRAFPSSHYLRPCGLCHSCFQRLAPSERKAIEDTSPPHLEEQPPAAPRQIIAFITLPVACILALHLIWVRIELAHWWANVQVEFWLFLTVCLVHAATRVGPATRRLQTFTSRVLLLALGALVLIIILFVLAPRVS